MTDKPIPVYIENKTVSDDVYLIQRICKFNGTEVVKDEIIATFETSKSIVDVYAPESGFIFYNNITEGAEVAVGFLLAIINRTPDLDIKVFDTFKPIQQTDTRIIKEGATNNSEVLISNAAKKLILDYKLSVDDFAGKKIIRTQDVLDFVTAKRCKCIIDESEKVKSINKIMIIGSGGHARMCLEVLRQSNEYDIAGIVDSNLHVGTIIHGLPVIGAESDIDCLYNSGITNAVIGFSALHKPDIRDLLYRRLMNIGMNLPNIVHKSAILEPSVVMGSGNQIMAGAIVGSDVVIGNNCILNSGSIVSHDCILSDNVHIAPGAILAGSVIVGHNSIIGMGATIYMKVRIGENCVIYNGTNVFENISSFITVKA